VFGQELDSNERMAFEKQNSRQARIVVPFQQDLVRRGAAECAVGKADQLTRRCGRHVKPPEDGQWDRQLTVEAGINDESDTDRLDEARQLQPNPWEALTD